LLIFFHFFIEFVSLLLYFTVRLIGKASKSKKSAFLSAFVIFCTLSNTCQITSDEIKQQSQISCDLTIIFINNNNKIDKNIAPNIIISHGFALTLILQGEVKVGLNSFDLKLRKNELFCQVYKKSYSCRRSCKSFKIFLRNFLKSNRDLQLVLPFHAKDGPLLLLCDSPFK
jgi:hypothetical protein